MAYPSIDSLKRIARWESRSGKHWVDVYQDDLGCTFRSPDYSGTMGDMSPDAAIAEIERRVNMGLFQPDKARTKMSRVV